MVDFLYCLLREAVCSETWDSGHTEENQGLAPLRVILDLVRWQRMRRYKVVFSTASDSVASIYLTCGPCASAISVCVPGKRPL